MLSVDIFHILKILYIYLIEILNINLIDGYLIYLFLYSLIQYSEYCDNSRDHKVLKLMELLLVTSLF